MISLLLVLVVVTALAFDFTNGFHDTANAMATSIATGALRPRVAVAISAVANLVGAFLSTEVAKTISGGLIRGEGQGFQIQLAWIFAGLVGAILWNLLTWLLGLPSSSSHAMFGGLIGAVIIGAGVEHVDFGTVLGKVVLPALLSPVVAGLAALLSTYLVYRLTESLSGRRVEAAYRHGQTITATLVSLAHGTGDAQKTMGLITLALISANLLPADAAPPIWVIAAAGVAIAVGTFTGGWRIIRTVGKGVTEIESPQGFAAEASSTATLLVSSHLGFALSTTQVCTGSIIGSGLGRRLARVRWGTVGRMVLAWLLTLPAAGAVGGLAAWVASFGGLGEVVVFLGLLGMVGAILTRARRSPVTAHNVNEPVPVPVAA